MRPQAIVTGGTRGIGRAICIDLAKAGYDVAFTYKSSSSQALELEKELGGKSKGYALDISDADLSMDEILKDFPQPEVLVNNAGISIDGLSMRFKSEDFDKLVNTNVRGAFLVTQNCIRPMMKARKGSIIFVSSVIGQMGNQGQVAYSTTKAALLGMTKSFAKELGSRNIRVNAIAPGFIRTDMTESLPQATKEGILSGIPLGYFAEPEDVAKVVTFLSSSSSRYITGQVIAVNGGLYV